MNNKKQKTALHFLCYNPRVYSALDRFTIALSLELQKKGYKSVFIFTDELNIKELEIDILKTGSSIELLNTRQSKINILKDIRKLLKKYRPKLIHSHFEPYIKNLLAVMCFAYRINFYISNHSLKFDMTAEEYLKEKGLLKAFRWILYLRFWLLFCDKSFCVSEAVRSEYINFSKINSKKLKTLYLGVKIDSERSSRKLLRERLNLPSNKILIVNISAIDYVKGIDTIIKATKLLKEKYNLDNFQVLHVGGLRSINQINIKYQQTLIDLHKELLGNSNCFLWLGRRNNVDEILSASDIYIHPSRKEGLGTTIMEAFSAHLPAVGTNVGGIPEIINNNITGFIIEPDDEFNLADKINHLIINGELRRNMGNNAYSAVKEKWNIKKQVIKMIEEYGEL